MDIVDFLRARLDEDAEVAREAAHFEAGRWTTEGGYPVSVADELPELADVFEQVVVFGEGSPSEEQAAHIARHDPARVLAEVDAKWRMIREVLGYAAKIDGEWGCCHDADAIAAGQCPETQPKDITALRLLALPYADHPDYRQDWRP